MKRNIKMVVFDMAGTTVDEGNLVYKTLQKTLINKGINCTLDEVLTHGAGKDKRKAIVDIIAYLNFPITILEVDEIFIHFLKALSEAYKYAEVIPQKNAEEVFEILHKKNILIVLNTGYDSATAHSLLVKLNWVVGVTVDQLITASDVDNGRPNPDMIQLAMKQFNISDSSNVAKVGDSIIDIEEGKNANCGLVVGITTGAHTTKQLASAEPNFIIDNLEELLTYIQ